MSAKGKIAKQEKANKAIEIIAWIVEQANTGKAVILTDDWGGNTLTLGLGKIERGKIEEYSHTHVGDPCNMDTGLEDLIDRFHSTVVGKGGMSWHTEKA